MSLYDSSALIDFLDGDKSVVNYIKARPNEARLTIPLVLFELYQGEVYKPGETNLDGLESALSWVEVIDEKPRFSRVSAELQDTLNKAGEPLAARNAYIAGAAKSLNQELIATDSDFDDESLKQEIRVEIL